MEQVTVEMTPDAARQFDKLPVVIRRRVEEIFGRLGRWPDVSGVKPMRRELKGSYRARTGGWRVLFTVNDAAGVVLVFRIDNRRDVYEY